MLFFFINQILWKHIIYNVILCIVFFITDHLNVILSLLRWHWIQNTEKKKPKTKEIETWKTKTHKDENLVLPKE